MKKPCAERSGLRTRARTVSVRGMIEEIIHNDELAEHGDEYRKVFKVDGVWR